MPEWVSRPEPRVAGHSSTGQPSLRATVASPRSGLTATGCPTARSNGRSEWLSA